MKSILPLTLAMTLTTALAAAPPYYNSAPDWVSVDRPFSTGGALVDLDRDGWLDLVSADGNDMQRAELTVYYNDGAGNFPTSPDWESSDLEYNGHVSVADVNGDGWPDVAVGLTADGFGTPTARLYLNNGGTLSSLPDWESDITYAGFQVAFGDVNGDGRPDLAVGTGWPYSTPHPWHNYIYLNTGTALEDTPSWTSDDTWDFGDIFFCDANRDGWLDLIGVGEDTDTWVYLNEAGTLATTAAWHTTDNPSQFSVMGTCGDINGDGWIDLITTDNTQLGGSGDFRLYRGLLGGLFTTTPQWSYFEQYGSAVALADIDADGDLDLATGGWWGHTRYFLNTGTTLPETPDWSSGGTSVVESIVFGDVDKDGVRFPTETLAAVPDRHVYQLARQPVDAILHVTVDGVELVPNEYTADPVLGWVSVGPAPVTAVTVQYRYSLRPDMAITNWDSSLGNYLYYNLNSGVPRLGDFDDSGYVDADDLPGLADCLTGPGGEAAADCGAGDADLDDDVDLADIAFVTRMLAAP